MNGFLHILRGVGHGIKVAEKAIEKPALKVADIALEVAPVAFPASAPLAAGISGIFHKALEGTELNPLEAFAITMVMGIVQSTVKNPAHKAALQHQLVGIADMIYASYGMVSPVALAPVTDVTSAH